MKKGQLERLPLRPKGKSSRDTKIQGLDVIICAILVFYAILIIFPFWNAFIISISSEDAYLHSNLLLWPTELDLSSYKKVFADNNLWSGFGITMILLVGGTFYQLFFTVITGYALSRHNWTGKNLVMNMILVTMFFGGGMVPYYYLIRDLGMMNTIWVMIIPGAIDTFNMLLMRNYFASLPPEMEESAKIDGANANLSWIRKEQLLSNGMKTKAIRALCQTDRLFAALDTLYEMSMAGFQKMRYFNAILSFCG